MNLDSCILVLRYSFYPNSQHHRNPNWNPRESRWTCMYIAGLRERICLRTDLCLMECHTDSSVGDPPFSQDCGKHSEVRLVHFDEFWGFQSKSIPFWIVMVTFKGTSLPTELSVMIFLLIYTSTRLMPSSHTALKYALKISTFLQLVQTPSLLPRFINPIAYSRHSLGYQIHLTFNMCLKLSSSSSHKLILPSVFGPIQFYSSSCKPKPLETSLIPLCFIPNNRHISQGYIQKYMYNVIDCNHSVQYTKIFPLDYCKTFYLISLLCPNSPCRWFSTQQPGSDSVTPLLDDLTSLRAPYNHRQVLYDLIPLVSSSPPPAWSIYISDFIS